MNSIDDLALNFIKNIHEIVFSSEIRSLDDLSADLNKQCKEVCIKLIEQKLSSLNDDIRCNKAVRKEQHLVLHKRNRARICSTELGEVHYRRDYYRNTAADEYVYPLDKMIGVYSYERISRNVSARMVEEATRVSYGEAARVVTGGTVSRQTVRNKILKMGPLQYSEEHPKKRIVSELHIYADEDHDHLQKPGKKKGKCIQINPLVVVTEGTKPTGTGRNETIHPMRFVNAEFDTKKLSQAVEGYLYDTYDMEQVEKIYLHADGGTWIQGLLPEMKQKVDVLDGYHLEKYLKQVSAKFSGQSVRHRLMCAIQNDDRKKADRIFQDLLGKAENDRTREVVKRTAKYILGHWDAMVRRKTEDIPGSCTEAQISHVLASRFSRDPLGWSKEGLGKLSSQRVYVLNGGKITGSTFRNDDKRYEEYLDRYEENLLNKKHDWSVVEGQMLNIFDTASGTQQEIRKLGRMRDCTKA